MERLRGGEAEKWMKTWGSRDRHRKQIYINSLIQSISLSRIVTQSRIITVSYCYSFNCSTALVLKS